MQTTRSTGLKFVGSMLLQVVVFCASLLALALLPRGDRYTTAFVIYCTGLVVGAVGRMGRVRSVGWVGVAIMLLAPLTGLVGQATAGVATDSPIARYHVHINWFGVVLVEIGLALAIVWNGAHTMWGDLRILRARLVGGDFRWLQTIYWHERFSGWVAVAFVVSGLLAWQLASFGTALLIIGAWAAPVVLFTAFLTVYASRRNEIRRLATASSSANPGTNMSGLASNSFRTWGISAASDSAGATARMGPETTALFTKLQSEFHVRWGSATDVLSKKSAAALTTRVSIAPGGFPLMSLIKDLCQCVLVIGGMGSGKTSGPLGKAREAFLQLPTAGVLEFSGKLADADKIQTRALQYRIPQQIHLWGTRDTDGHAGIVRGMTPQAIGAAFGDMIPQGKDPHWSITAGLLMEKLFSIVEALGQQTIRIAPKANRAGEVTAHAYDFRTNVVRVPERIGIKKETREEVVLAKAYDLTIKYNIQTAYTLLHANDHLFLAVGSHLQTYRDHLRGLSGATVVEKRKLRFVERATDWLFHEFARMREPDNKEFSGIVSALAPLLNAVLSPDIAAAFDDPGDGEDDFIMEDALSRGEVVVLATDPVEYPNAEVVLQALAFRRLDAMMQRRTKLSRATLDANPIGFNCDEYGSWANTNHIKTWEKLRESRICAVVAIISVNSLIDRFKSQAAAYRLIGSFGSIVCGRTQDPDSKKLMDGLFGGYKFTDVSTSVNNAAHYIHQLLAMNVNESYRDAKEQLLDEHIWDSLGVNEGTGTVEMLFCGVVNQKTVLAHGLFDQVEELVA